MVALSRGRVKSKRAALRKRAARKNVVFAMSSRHIRKLYSTEACPICKEKFLDIENHKKCRSVDRLIPAIGYINKNTFVLCKECNEIKDNLSLEELEENKLDTFVVWMRSQIKKVFILEDHVKIIFDKSNKLNRMSFQITDEFKIWFKENQQLKRWSDIRFQKWAQETFAAGLGGKTNE